MNPLPRNEMQKDSTMAAGPSAAAVDALSATACAPMDLVPIRMISPNWQMTMSSLISQTRKFSSFQTSFRRVIWPQKMLLETL
jgi:hypothetical protein